MFHVGHLNILKRSKELCDYLIVGVTVDELVKYKKRDAVIPFSERQKIVEAIKYVDEVVPQTSMDKFSAWKELKFDVVFVGSDWKGTEKWKNIERKFTEVNVKVVYFEYTKNISSSILREKMKKII